VDFFYDKQIRRFMNQFVRIFSYMYVQYGNDANGNQVLYRVPCRYADTNRQVAAILRQNSDNNLNNVPMIVVYITDVKYDRTRMQEPKFVDKTSIRQRAIDPHTGNASTQQGNTFSLDRLMPAPYRLTVKMEVWTSNFDQKLQIFEQIASQFNPDMEIQSTDNYLDWTSLSYILLTDTNWTTRNIPVGSDDPIDIATFTFEMPIWITTPAKLKRLGVIQSVVASIYDGNGNIQQSLVDQTNLLGNRQFFTPTGYQVVVNNGNVALLKQGGPVLNNTNYTIPTTLGNAIPWASTIASFGNIVANYSMLYLTNAATERLVVGTVAYDATNPNNLLFNVDSATIPTNILPSVNAIVDPQVNGPGAGLPAASSGQRYLIVNNLGGANLGNGAAAWQNANSSVTVAQANDIIQYSGNAWTVAYHPTPTSNASYVTNTFSSIQYAWNGSQWQKSWEGLYPEGYWSIVI
jgi:hypothetical protein